MNVVLTTESQYFCASFRIIKNAYLIFFVSFFSESNDNYAEGNQDDDGNTSDLPNPSSRCPLCQENYPNYTALETHVMHIHSVNSEGLQNDCTNWS